MRDPALPAASANGGRCEVAWAHAGSALVRLEVVGTREPRVWSQGPLSSEYVLSWV